jgi:glyceraldehyde-3-phosphate dehydrogenase/erythrose-4-phosphate dehydrogenase
VASVARRKFAGCNCRARLLKLDRFSMRIDTVRILNTIQQSSAEPVQAVRHRCPRLIPAAAPLPIACTTHVASDVWCQPW